jgi:hypothetical protein
MRHRTLEHAARKFGGKLPGKLFKLPAGRCKFRFDSRAHLIQFSACCSPRLLDRVSSLFLRRAPFLFAAAQRRSPHLRKLILAPLNRGFFLAEQPVGCAAQIVQAPLAISDQLQEGLEEKPAEYKPENQK